MTVGEIPFCYVAVERCVTLMLIHLTVHCPCLKCTPKSLAYITGFEHFFFCAKVSLRVTALPWMPSCSIAKCMYACIVNVQRRAIWNDNIKLHESLLFASNSENSRLYLNRYMWVCLQVGHLSTYNLDIFVALCNLYPTIQIEICDVTKIRCTIISVCALSENCGWQPHCTIHRKCQQACT